MRVVVYTRLSRRNTTNAANIEDQLKRCREHAAKRGWAIVAEHSDYGESAFARDEMDDRPGYADLLAAIRSSECDVVLAWRPDRLWRDPIECAVMMRMCVTHGVQTVATVTEGDRDPANPGDEMVSTIVAAVGRYESAAKAARVRAKQRQLAEIGRHGGGGLPAYGYTTHDRSTIDEAEAAVLRRVVDNLLAGASVRSQTLDMHRRGELTKLGQPWTTSNLRRLIRMPFIAGLRTHRSKIVGQAQWPAIIPVDHWLALQDVLSDPHRARKWPTGREYLLTRGLAICGLCDTPLIARPRSDGRRAYACASGAPDNQGCGKIGRLADPLEADVESRFKERVDLGLLANAEPAEPSVTVNDVNTAEAKLTGLARDHYVHGVIGRDEYLAAREPLAEEAERLRRALGAGGRQSMSVDDLRDGWDEMTVGEKREAMRPFVIAVVVGPCVRGRKAYDPTSVDVLWRKPGTPTAARE